MASRCGCTIPVVQSARSPGSAGIDTVVLQLDQDEEVRLQDDRKGGALIDQPFRPESVVALRAWLDQLQAHWDEQLASYKRHVEGRR